MNTHHVRSYLHSVELERSNDPINRAANNAYQKSVSPQQEIFRGSACKLHASTNPQLLARAMRKHWSKLNNSMRTPPINQKITIDRE